MKVCSRCKLVKDITEFGIRTAEKDGHSSHCKKCEQLRSKNKHKKYILRAKKNWKSWYKDNKEKRTVYARERRSRNIQARLAHSLRNRLNSILKTSKVGSAIKNLGCSLAELKEHLESKFQDGMTWDNYGEWHIDHIKPLASFDLTDREQFLEACNYSNLQPLWALDNLKKSDS